MKHYCYAPCGVCTRTIDFDIDTDGTVHNVCFAGGCPGNTQGVARLAEGLPAAKLAQMLGGVDCRGRGTSCPDQFAQALRQALADRQ